MPGSDPSAGTGLQPAMPSGDVKSRDSAVRMRAMMAGSMGDDQFAEMHEGMAKPGIARQSQHREAQP